MSMRFNFFYYLTLKPQHNKKHNPVFVMLKLEGIYYERCEKLTQQTWSLLKVLMEKEVQKSKISCLVNIAKCI